MDFADAPEESSHLLSNIVFAVIAILIIILLLRLIRKAGTGRLMRIIKPLLLVLVSGAIIWYLMQSGADWKKKQFVTCEEMQEAFKGVDYDEIEAEFGTPINKYDHFHGFGCDGDEASTEATWDGVGVNGRNQRIQFKAVMLTGMSSLTPLRSCSIICD